MANDGFSWSHYVGLTVPTYTLFGITAQNSVDSIGSVPGNQSFYNYINPSTGYVRFFIGFNAPACTAKGQKLVKSNLVNSIFISVDDPQPSVSAFMLFPNPFTNELIITSSDTESPIHFELINALGQIVTNATFTEQDVIQTESFGAGVYFIRLTDGSNVWFQKVIKR
jgi:hypothetical protein